jgi:ABC-2 type transport system permease protein
MTIATRELRASFAFVERNFNLTKRYWGWEIAWLVYSLAAALAVAFIGVAQDDPVLLQTLIIGAIFWNFLSIVFGFIGETVTWERWEGTLEYTFMAPVRRYTQLIGSTFFAVAYAVIQMVIILAVMLLFFDVRFTGGNWVTAGVFLALGSVSFVGVGMMAAILPLLYVERGDQMVFVIQSIILLFSGVYYSSDILPDWMQFVGQFSPGTYVLDGIRGGLIHGKPVTDLLNDVWPLVVMGVVLIPLGVYVFGIAERYAKRTGKLKRVG